MQETRQTDAGGAMTVASLVALAAFVVLGVLLWLVAPVGDLARRAQFAKDLMSVGPPVVFPKTKERLVYLGLVFATPFIMVGLGGIFAKRRWTTVVFDQLMLVCGLGAAAYVLSKDQIASIVKVPAAILAISVIVGFAVAWKERDLNPRVAKGIKIGLFSALAAFALFLSYSWRVFNAADSVTTLPFDNMGATLFSVGQINHAATCTIDLAPQYGCYGEFLRPIWAVLGLSVLKFTLVMATLTAISSLAILWTAHKLIRSPSLTFAAGVALIASLNLPLLLGPPADPYFQYVPLRAVFPALSLLLVQWWLGKASLARAVVLGAVGAVALLWNADSGLFVLSALGLAVVFAHPQSLMAAVKSGAAYALGCGLAWGLLWAAWSAGAGRPADLTQVFHYVRIVTETGALMLPTPPPPAAWTLGAALVVIALVRWTLRRRGLAEDARITVCAYAAILGIGLINYYLGRSYYTNFWASCWPLLLVLFGLLDNVEGQTNLVCRAAAWPCIVAVSSAVIGSWPYTGHISQARWSGVLHPKADAALVQDVAFIRKESAGQPFDVISPNQAVYYAQTDHAATWSGPGFVELMLWSEADRLREHIVRHGPPHLFFSPDALLNQGGAFRSPSWLMDHLAELRTAYALKGWDPKGNGFAHLVRKPFLGPDLFDFAPDVPAAAFRSPNHFVVRRGGVLVTTLGQPIGPDWMAPGDDYTVEAKVKVAPGPQVDHAAMLSTHYDPFHGTVIFATPGKAPGFWSLGAGDGAKWMTPAEFTVPIDRPFDLMLRYTRKTIMVTVDGKEVARLTSDPAHPFDPGGLPLTLGDWIRHDRPLSGEVLEAIYIKNGSTAEHLSAN